MKQLKNVFLFCCVLLAFNKSIAQVTQVINVSTGVNNSNGSLLPSSNPDDTWQVQAPGQTSFEDAYDVYDPINYPEAPGCCEWRGPIGSIMGGVLGGNAIFRMQFSTVNYSNCNASNIISAKLVFSYLNADDAIVDFNVNSTPYTSPFTYTFSPQPAFNPSTYIYNPSTPLTVNIPVSALLSGINYIDFDVYNYSAPGIPATELGIAMCAQLELTYSAPLNPVFTTSPAICSGSQIIVDGSATNDPSINGNVWTVVESNSAGVPVTGATEWWSPFFAGSPGYYVMPTYASGGPQLSCGKYYRVKLAVNSPCNSGSDITHVIFVNCPPTVNLGPDQTICNGSCVTLNPGRGIYGYTYDWVIMGDEPVHIGSTQSITVCPTATTTYCLTKTETATGCSSTDCVTISVMNNNPSFSLATNTMSTAYCTVALTANDLTAFSQPGFVYTLSIEELDGLGNPYPAYPDNGTNCWWNYPGVETFEGYVSTGTGTYTQSGWWPTTCPGAGQFLYGHTYRITRGTQNNYCELTKTSLTITPVAPHHKCLILQTDDNTVTDNDGSSLLTDDVKKDIELSIYPNPGNGLFTIEMSTADKASIEVFNALGEKVRSYEQNDSKSILNITDLPKGMYMVNIISNGKKISKKIIFE